MRRHRFAINELAAPRPRPVLCKNCGKHSTAATICGVCGQALRPKKMPLGIPFTLCVQPGYRGQGYSGVISNLVLVKKLQRRPRHIPGDAPLSVCGFEVCRLHQRVDVRNLKHTFLLGGTLSPLFGMIPVYSAIILSSCRRPCLLVCRAISGPFINPLVRNGQSNPGALTLSLQHPRRTNPAARQKRLNDLGGIAPPFTPFAVQLPYP
jgi:hypothetical protein